MKDRPTAYPPITSESRDYLEHINPAAAFQESNELLNISSSTDDDHGSIRKPADQQVSSVRGTLSLSQTNKESKKARRGAESNESFASVFAQEAIAKERDRQARLCFDRELFMFEMEQAKAKRKGARMYFTSLF